MTSQRGMPSFASMRINKSASAAGAPSGFSFDDFGPELQNSICTENFRKKKTIPAVITGKDAFFCEKYSITASNPFMHQLRRNNPSISLLLQGDPHILPLNLFFAATGENRSIRLSTDCLTTSKRACRPHEPAFADHSRPDRRMRGRQQSETTNRPQAKYQGKHSTAALKA